MNTKYIRTYIFLIFTLSGWLTNLYSQFTISGYVVDKENRETVIGATVVLKGTTRGTATNLDGYFQITGLEEGSITLVINHVSYENRELSLEIKNKSRLLNEISLVPKVNSLDEISVIGMKTNDVGDKEIETSQLSLTAKAIESIPSARNDVFKAIKYLPGVEAAEPLSPLYSVRGGDPGENKVILDGITIYNPYHFATSSGIFNVQTIKNIDMLIGGFGAEFGGSNSSIMHITTKEGNKNELKGEVFPSIASTKVVVEAPAGNNASFMIGGRYFYDFQSAFMLYNNSYFYDYNLSYSKRFNNKNWLSIKFFQSKDKTTYDFGNMFSYLSNSFDIEEYENINMGIDNRWNNMAGSVMLKKIWTPSIYMTSQVYYSTHKSTNYSFMDLLFEIDDEDGPYDYILYYNTRFKSYINDITAKTNFNIKLGMYNTLKAGIEHSWYHFENAAIITDIDQGKEIRSPIQLSWFLEDKIKAGNLIIRPGLRYTQYSYYKNTYFEPRVNLVYNIGRNTKFKAAYGTYYQYIISMNTIEYEINQFLDYYYPLKNLKPSKSSHYIAGVEQKIYKNNLTFKTEIYYKDINRTYAFDLTQSEVEIFTLSDKVKAGKGKAYGIELKLEGNIKKLSGWFGYTLSKSTRTFAHINNGRSYPFDYSRTHSAKLLLNYQINPKLSYSTTLLVMSGQPRTIENYSQNLFTYQPNTGQMEFTNTNASSIKNNARLPMLIEWDLGVKKRLRKGFGAELQDFLGGDESYLNVTIANILFFRRNVLWYFPTGGEKYLPIGFNYFPFINAGYILKF